MDVVPKAAETVVETAANAFWSRWKVYIVLAGGLLAIVAFGLLYWLVFIRPGAAQHAAQISHAQSEMAQGGQQSAHQAISTIEGNHAGERKTDQQTEINHVTIIKAAGAGDPVNPAVDDAGRRAVCMRHASADLPDCKRLLDPHP